MIDLFLIIKLLVITNWMLSSVAMMRCSMSFQARIMDKYIYFTLFLLIFSLCSLWLKQSNPSKVKIQSYCHTPKIRIRFLISRTRFHPIQNTTQFRWPCWDAIQADHGYCMKRRANNTKRTNEICKIVKCLYRILWKVFAKLDRRWECT